MAKPRCTNTVRKRPAASIVLDMDAWLEELEQKATEAAQAYSEEQGKQVVCDYLGQKYVSKGAASYRRNPQDWKCLDDLTRKEVKVVFRWTMPDSQGEAIETEQRNRDVRTGNVKRPADNSLEWDDWLETLVSRGSTAARDLSALLQKEVSCEYLGQKSGRARAPSYRKHPREWKVCAGQWRSQVKVCYRWSLSVEHVVEITEGRHDHIRCRKVPTPQSSTFHGVTTDRVWGNKALETLHQAAQKFIDCYGPSLFDEFGVQVRCVCLGIFKVETTYYHKILRPT